MLPSDSFDFKDRAIHVWPVRLTASDPALAELESVLAPDEKDRAARFRFERHQRAFIIARGALRTLLAGYLNQPPASVRFDYGSKGKPALVLPEGVHFNLSHSADLAAFAFTRACDIGIDVERIQPVPDMQDVARRFFCAAETAELASLPEPQRELGFFHCWTRKEAYIKATGEGLSAPLDQFQVSLQPGAPARIFHLSGDAEAAAAWNLLDLDLTPGYAAALAYCGAPRPVHVLPPLARGKLVWDPEELLPIK